ncbi:MAG: hypothetical protein K8R87_14185 [Verrucomicrobia bacterium]|nr:hypothetical protein [Verrucomicrobiota bacterium]
MSKYIASTGLCFFLLGLSQYHLLATGFYGPQTVLDDGAKQVLLTPEFFWELECKRLAQEFKPAEVRNTAERAATENAELAEAVKSGYLKSKEDIAGTDFEDYRKGAAHSISGNIDEARAAWEALLNRPAAERKHRSVWAEYMLGKFCLSENKFDQAVKHFQNTRQLAKDGFVDSWGLAADSYGWEARAELDAGHAEKAARLYLTQLALGDVSAVVSLKALIPDRDGMSDQLEKDAPTPLALKAYGAKTTEEAMKKAAHDPLLRRLVTLHVLAVGVDSEYTDGESKLKPTRQKRWLAAVESTNVKATPDAEHLGWVAYSAGQYADAGRWLKLSEGKSSAACWLKGKLALRDGKLKESADLLSEAVHNLPKQEELENSLLVGEEMFPREALNGDLGTVHLARAEFVKALEAFLAADLWEDAAYVAERCLTSKELLDYIRANPPKPKDKPKTSDDLSPPYIDPHDYPAKLRNLAARRLVREDDYKNAREFFDEEMQKTLGNYTDALAEGTNEKTPKKERARALFHAANIARNHGMELMGTEVGPDGGSENGAFGFGDLAVVRLTGKAHLIEDWDADENTKLPRPSFALPVSAEEKKRLAATKINPELRYHYRHVAAGLAWKAAALLPDEAEETADVLNTAGNWIKAKHEKQADRFYQALEKRCSKTTIGKEAVKKHWFVDTTGPWSSEE